MADHAIWNCHPEKVLAVTEDWHDSYPETHLAMITALIEALQWMEDPQHQEELIEILAEERYINVDAKTIAPGVKGLIPLIGQSGNGFPDFNLFMRNHAAFPWRSHALWILTQMARWGKIDIGQDLVSIASRVYRPDLYREAARLLDVPVPLQDSKVEGLSALDESASGMVNKLELGSSLFCDGSQFDPADPSGYIYGFEIHNRSKLQKNPEVAAT
jgi:nitrate/nitrite transport system substrate-binding protein